jgi:hypothetical protein
MSRIFLALTQDSVFPLQVGDEPLDGLPVTEPGQVVLAMQLQGPRGRARRQASPVLWLRSATLPADEIPDGAVLVGVDMTLTGELDIEEVTQGATQIVGAATTRGATRGKGGRANVNQTSALLLQMTGSGTLTRVWVAFEVPVV